MGKRTRIVLYALSLVTMLAMVTLIIFSHGRQSGEPAKDALSETDISSTEEPVQIPEAEESEETEAADGQNRIQNDTEQEEVDIADDTTLIFAGDVLFANAFKSNYDAGDLSNPGGGRREPGGPVCPDGGIFERSDRAAAAAGAAGCRYFHGE